MRERLVPALDHTVLSYFENKWFITLVARVKFISILKGATIVDSDLVARLGFWSIHERDTGVNEHLKVSILEQGFQV